MESATCCGMESMRSIVWHQAAAKYTLGDAMRLTAITYTLPRDAIPSQRLG